MSLKHWTFLSVKKVLDVIVLIQGSAVFNCYEEWKRGCEALKYSAFRYSSWLNIWQAKTPQDSFESDFESCELLNIFTNCVIQIFMQIQEEAFWSLWRIKAYLFRFFFNLFITEEKCFHLFVHSFIHSFKLVLILLLLFFCKILVI